MRPSVIAAIPMHGTKRRDLHGTKRRDYTASNDGPLTGFRNRLALAKADDKRKRKAGKRAADAKRAKR